MSTQTETHDATKYNVGDRVVIARKTPHAEGWSLSWAPSLMDRRVNDGKTYTIDKSDGTHGYLLRLDGVLVDCKWPSGCFDLVVGAPEPVKVPESEEVSKKPKRKVVGKFFKVEVDEDHLRDMVGTILDEKYAPRLVVLDKTQEPAVKLDIGKQHYTFELILRCIRAGVNVALVGGAGTGKTTTVDNIATALGRKFYPKSFSRMTTESNLMGYMDAGGVYRRTVLREAFEHGGVFCGDEFDAGNENVVVALNAMLANGFCSFPDGVIKKHPDFVAVICMNTYGNGGNRLFVGRNQLDAATRDRFVTVDFNIDNSIEAAMAGVDEGQPKFKVDDGGVPSKKDWLEIVRRLRVAIDKAEVRHIVSPRAVDFGCRLIDQGIGLNVLKEIVLWKGLEKEQRDRVTSKLPSMASF